MRKKIWHRVWFRLREEGEISGLGADLGRRATSGVQAPGTRRPFTAPAAATTGMIVVGVRVVGARDHVRLFVRQGEERVALGAAEAAALRVREKGDEEAREQQAEENGDRDDGHAWICHRNLISRGPTRLCAGCGSLRISCGDRKICAFRGADQLLRAFGLALTVTRVGRGDPGPSLTPRCAGASSATPSGNARSPAGTPG